MPGPLHQGLVFLLNRHPELAFRLAAHFDPAFAALGEPLTIVAASNELPDPSRAGNILHADGVAAAVLDPDGKPGRWSRDGKRYRASLAIEAQTRVDLFKLFTWLSHAAGARRRFCCRGWTLVFCPDPDVRGTYQKIFADEPRAAPWFVEPEMLPVILTVEDALEDWPMAVLSSVFHATSDHAVASVRATLEALHRLAPEDVQVYIDLMLSPLSPEQVEALPQTLLQYDPNWEMGPMEKRSGFYLRGKAEGLEQGRLAAKREMVSHVLACRSMTVSPAQQEQLEACADVEVLDRWLDLALRAASAEEVFG